MLEIRFAQLGYTELLNEPVERRPVQIIEFRPGSSPRRTRSIEGRYAPR
jgi:hypothetical protein